MMIQAADHIMCTHNIASNAMQIYAVFTTIGICMIDNTLTINFKPKCTVIYSVMSCTFIHACYGNPSLQLTCQSLETLKAE
jgi:hypothetical protein